MKWIVGCFVVFLFILTQAPVAEAGCGGIRARMQDRRAARQDRRADRRGSYTRVTIFHRRVEAPAEQTPQRVETRLASTCTNGRCGK